MSLDKIPTLQSAKRVSKIHVTYFLAYLLSQKLHGNGRSWVWTRSWREQCSERLKFLWQCRHWYTRLVRPPLGLSVEILSLVTSVDIVDAVNRLQLTRIEHDKTLGKKIWVEAVLAKLPERSEQDGGHKRNPRRGLP